ncbi:hypothetical protein EBT23_02220 [bacterium]|nr:hypothetical protein [bacterium]
MAERKKLAGNIEFAVEPENKFQGNWTVAASGGEHRDMESGTDWLSRQDELLRKLAARAASCPGLYPVREADDFLRVATDHAGPGPAEVCRILEALWQHPEQAVQMNAQSLIQRGKGWKGMGNEMPRLKKAL